MGTSAFRRWRLAVAATVLLCAGCGSSQRTAASPSGRATRARAAGTYGDLNANGVVDAADATKVLRVVVKLDAAPSDLGAMDFNGNGAIDAADATKVLRVVVALDPVLSVPTRYVPTRALTTDADHGAVRGSVQKRLKRARVLDPAATTAVWVTVGGHSYFQTTDAQGNYSFGNLPTTAALSITAAAPGCGQAPTSAAVTANTVTNVPDLVLLEDPTDTTGALAGYVYNAQGAPVGGAFVTLAGTDRTCLTEADGYFVFVQLAPGNYGLSAQVGGVWYQQAAAVSSGQTTASDFHLGSAPQQPHVMVAVDATNAPLGTTLNFSGDATASGGATITGYRWDFGDGSPVVAGAAASHIYTAAGTYRATLTATDSNGQVGAAWLQVLLTDGRLRVTIEPAAAIVGGAHWFVDASTQLNDSGATVAGLAPGEHTVTGTQVTGFGYAEAHLSVAGTGTTTATLVYHATGFAVQGTVKGLSGQPLSTARVETCDGTMVSGAVSGPDGGYTLFALPSGPRVVSYALVGQTTAYRVTVGDGTQVRLDVTLAPYSQPVTGPPQLAVDTPSVDAALGHATISGTVSGLDSDQVIVIVNGAETLTPVGAGGTFSSVNILAVGDNTVSVRAVNAVSTVVSPVQHVAWAPSRASLFRVTLTWDGGGDLDLHTWDPNLSHCYFAQKTIASGELDHDTIFGYGPEDFACTTPNVGRFRLGVSSYDGAGQTATLRVHVDSGPTAGQSFAFGPYTFTGSTLFGGYPVTVNTDSWWRPCDLVVAADGSVSVAAADATALSSREVIRPKARARR